MDPFQKDDKSYLGNLDYISRRNSVCDSGVPGKSSEYTQRPQDHGHHSLHGDWSPGAPCCLVAKLCLALCNPMDCSPPGFSVHGILQARILEWVAISFFRGIFLTQGSNPRLLHWQVGSLPLSRHGSPLAGGL